MQIAPVVKRSSGRPRSETTRVAILSTTMGMLEHATLQSITIESIAKTAGVSKATIYRWWPSKAALVIDAFLDHHIIRTPLRTDLPPLEALSQHMATLIRNYDGFGGRVVAQIIAEGQSDPDILREWRARFYHSRREAVRAALETWKAEAKVQKDWDIEFIMDVLYAPIYQRLLLRHAPLDDAFAASLANMMKTYLGSYAT
jgi:AcrR family transcriptional regulator